MPIGIKKKKKSNYYSKVLSTIKFKFIKMHFLSSNQGWAVSCVWAFTEDKYSERYTVFGGVDDKGKSALLLAAMFTGYHLRSLLMLHMGNQVV